MTKLLNRTFLLSILKNGTLVHHFKSRGKKSYLYFCHEIVFLTSTYSLPIKKSGRDSDSLTLFSFRHTFFYFPPRSFKVSGLRGFFGGMNIQQNLNFNTNKILGLRKKCQLASTSMGRK